MALDGTRQSRRSDLMADPQGNPVGGPVFRIWINLGRRDPKVKNHSAHPVEVQTNDHAALVKSLVPGLAQPFNRLPVGYRFGGCWWVGREGSAQGQGHRCSGGLEVCSESAQRAPSSRNGGRIGGFAWTIGLKISARRSLSSVGLCSQADFKTRYPLRLAYSVDFSAH